jgi:hypothetical protein
MMMQTTNDNVDNNVATQMTSNNADNNDAAADIHAAMQLTR